MGNTRAGSSTPGGHYEQQCCWDSQQNQSREHQLSASPHPFSPGRSPGRPTWSISPCRVVQRAEGSSLELTQFADMQNYPACFVSAPSFQSTHNPCPNHYGKEIPRNLPGAPRRAPRAGSAQRHTGVLVTQSSMPTATRGQGTKSPREVLQACRGPGNTATTAFSSPGD